MLKVNGFVAGESVEARAIMKRGSSATPFGRGALSSSPSAARGSVVLLKFEPEDILHALVREDRRDSPTAELFCWRPGSHGVARQ